MIDSRQGIVERTADPQYAELHPDVLTIFLDELHRVNPYAHAYRNMAQVLQDERNRANAAEEQIQPVRIIITHKPSQDRRYDDPTTSEIAAVYVGQDEAPPGPTERDIVIYPTA